MDDFYKGFNTLRSASEQPFLTLTDKLLTFSKSAIDALDQSPYVHVMMNEKDKILLVEKSDANKYALPFAKKSKNGRQILVRWGNKDILHPIQNAIGLDSYAEPIRIWGEFFPEHHAIKFDLSDYQKVEK